MKNKKKLDIYIEKLENKLEKSEKETLKLDETLREIYGSKIWKLLYIYKNLKKIYIFIRKKIIFFIKKEKYSTNSDSSYYFEHIKGKFEENKILGICHKDWKGIRSATENQCSDVLLIKEIHNLSHAKMILDFIKKNYFKKIAINGLPDNIEILIKIITLIDKKIDVYFIWHGSFTQQTIQYDHIYRLNKLYPFLKKIKKVGFVKKGMEKIFLLNGQKSEYIPNLISIHKRYNSNEINKNNIKIGIPSLFLWHKNNLNQLIAASLIKNAEINLLNCPPIRYLDNVFKNERIIIHDQLPKNEFEKLISNMDINCYVSLTECFPMVFLESLSLGIPCLIGKTSEFIVKKNKTLKKYLVVQNPEDIEEINKKLENIIKNYNQIKDESVKFIYQLVKENQKRVINFFN